MSQKLKHIAFIMDGNRRWAKLAGLPSQLGHSKGIRNIFKIIKECKEQYKIKYITLYALSIENLQRSATELDHIYYYVKRYITANVMQSLKREKIKISFIGNIKLLPKEIQEIIYKIEAIKSKDIELFVQVCIGYGFQQDIIKAVQNIATKVKNNQLALSDITHDTIRNELSTKDTPYPDLMLRTGGEQRISNFLLWELAYSELYFCNKMWPEFDKYDLQAAIVTYNSRERRYGK